MKEVYVSFEIAKLLKEKGFNWEVRTFYTSDGKLEYCAFELNHNLDIGSGFTSAPTQRMAMDWLMEEHDICIYCYPSNLPSYGKWESGACWIKDNVSVIFNNCSHSLYADTYKEAVEETLRYVLEHLISGTTFDKD